MAPTPTIRNGRGAVSFAEVIGNLTTYYRLKAFNGSTDLGATRQLCAAPGIGFFPS